MNIFILFIIYIIHFITTFAVTVIDETKQSQWKRLHQESLTLESQSHRQEILSNALKQSLGIYINDIISKNSFRKFWKFSHSFHSIPFNHQHYEYQFQSFQQACNTSVIVSTIVINSEESNDNNYNNLLYNFLCYLKFYNLKSVLFIYDSNITHFNEQSNKLHTLFDSHIQIVPYPTSLFWELISHKQSAISKEYATSDYEGNIPSFKHFGAFVMLVPIYEILQLGYDVIYFDIDISFFQDPLPYIFHGFNNLDIILSQETRSCNFPSFQQFRDRNLQTLNPYQYNWNDMEANTGIMYIRSNKKTILFYQHWLEKLIDTNKRNDQKVLIFHELYEDSQYDRSCNLYSQSTSNSSFRQRSNDTMLKYCYLDEFLFANGKMEFFCQQGLEEYDISSSMTAYVLAMKQLSYNHIIYNHSTHTLRHVHLPIALHVNYCDDKEQKLKDRGLWLFNDLHEKCHDIQLSHTSYGNMYWRKRIKDAIDDYIQQMRNITEDVILKYPIHGTTYVYYKYANSSLHYISHEVVETLLSKVNNHSLESIEKLSQTMYLLLPRGKDINS